MMGSLLSFLVSIQAFHRLSITGIVATCCDTHPPGYLQRLQLLWQAYQAIPLYVHSRKLLPPLIITPSLPRFATTAFQLINKPFHLIYHNPVRIIHILSGRVFLLFQLLYDLRTSAVTSYIVFCVQVFTCPWHAGCFTNSD